MKKEYIKPTILAKQMIPETMLTGSDPLDSESTTPSNEPNGEYNGSVPSKSIWVNFDN